MKFTGIYVDHLVSVGSLVGVKQTSRSYWLIFSNAAVQGGHTIAKIEKSALENSLGIDEIRWLMITLKEMNGRIRGQTIPCIKLLYITLEGKRLAWLFVDRDEETVEISFPLEDALSSMQLCLTAHLVKRGDWLKRKLMADVNRGYMRPRRALVAHNDHDLRHFDRTCKACREEVLALNSAICGAYNPLTA